MAKDIPDYMQFDEENNLDNDSNQENNIQLEDFLKVTLAFMIFFVISNLSPFF